MGRPDSGPAHIFFVQMLILYLYVKQWIAGRIIALCFLEIKFFKKRKTRSRIQKAALFLPLQIRF